MKKVSSFIVAIAFVLGGCAEAQSQSVDVSKFETGIKQAEVQLLDVRTPEEYEEGHIANAMLANINNKAEFDHRVAALDKDRPVYVYCLAGPRSTRAASILRDRGFKNVVELSGGITAWRRAGNELEGSSKQPEMTNEEYDKMITARRLVLVDFGAKWCPPCRKMQPIVDELEKKFNGKIAFSQIDAGSQGRLMNMHNVEQIPTFVLYKDGKQVWRASGVLAKAEMEAKLKEWSSK